MSHVLREEMRLIQHAARFVKFALYLLAAALCGCSNPGNTDTILMNDILEIKEFVSRIDSISVVPLQNNPSDLVGSMVELLSDSDSYYVIDNRNKKILRYSLDGHFLNGIGHRGRSQSEYVTIQNVQINDDTVRVYSEPDKINRYLRNGEFISSQTIEGLGEQTFFDGENYMTYYGYQAVRGYRFAGFAGKKKDYHSLKIVGKVLPFTSDEPIFSQGDNRIIMRDSFGCDLYQVTASGCEPYVRFDFKKYSIPESFFTATDYFEGAEQLLNSTFAHISRYVESGKYAVVSVIIQSPKGASFVYGIRDDDQWKWYFMGEPHSQPLSGSFRLIQNNCMVYIIEASRMNDIPDAVKGKITSGLYGHNVENCDYVIAKVYLR